MGVFQKSLVQNGLADYVAMDIKNSKRQYCKTAGIEESRELMERIQESVAFLLGHPVAYEFRTTVIQEYHTRESFEEIGRWIRQCHLVKTLSRCIPIRQR